MKCRKCGRELRAGVQKCPYCGMVVPVSGRKTDTGFNWNLNDSPPQSRPKAKNISPNSSRSRSSVQFDWNTDKLSGAGAGRVSFQKETDWKEPEEARQLFSFDQAHETLQKKVDLKVDTIAAEKPAPAIERKRREDLFVLPSDMTMDDFSDLLGESIVQESDRVLVVKSHEQNKPSQPEQQQTPSFVYEANPVRNKAGAREAAAASATMKPAEMPAAQNPERAAEQQLRQQPEQQMKPEIFTIPAVPSVPEEKTVPPKQEKQVKRRSPEDQAYDPFRGSNLIRMEEIPSYLSRRQSAKNPPLSFAGEAADASSASESGLETIRNYLDNTSSGDTVNENASLLTAIDPGYTPEEEKRAIEDFQNLIHAEKEFSEKVHQFTFMSEEEQQRAEKAWLRRENVSADPDSSFISLEEEYQKYRFENEGIDEEAAADDYAEKIISMEEPDLNAEETQEDIRETEISGPESLRETTEEEESAASAGKVRKAADIVRKTAEKAISAAESSVRSLVADDEEQEDDFSSKDVFSGQKNGKSAGRQAAVSRGTGTKKPRELNIKINEPSGTQFMVRTEEVEIPDQIVNLKDTQEVNLGKLKKGPKSVKVQVEVNNTSSSSSVEVTRLDDGATVVRTIEEGAESEHLYNALGEDLLYRRPEDQTFWERNKVPENRMTVSDIFSPELKSFNDEWEAEEKQLREEGKETVVYAPDPNRSAEPVSDEEIAAVMERFITSELENAAVSGEETKSQDAESAAEDAESAAEDQPDLLRTEEENTDAGVPEDADEKDSADSGIDRIPAEEQDEKTEITVPEETSEQEEDHPVKLSLEELDQKDESAERQEIDSVSDEEVSKDRVLSSAAERIAAGAAVTAVLSEESDAEPEESAGDQAAEDGADHEASAESAGRGISAKPEESGQKPEKTGPAEVMESPDGENIKQYEDLTTVLSSDQVREKIKAEAAKKEEETEEEITETEENPVQSAEEGHKKRAGRVQFKYRKKQDEEAADLEIEKSAVPPAEPEQSSEEETGEETGEMQGLFDSLNNIRGRIARMIGAVDEEEETLEEKSAESGEPAVSEEEQSDGERSTAEEKKGSRWSAALIMRIIIIILIIAIIIEFAVIGIKLLAPNSQGAVFINRIEQSIAGEDIGSTISADAYTLDIEDTENPEI